MPSNIALLESAAARLGRLLHEVVFVGGCALDLLITDPGAAPVRGTIDVDVVAKITTYPDYLLFSDRLKALGFSEDQSENAPLCRWKHGELRLDVMPVDATVLGFTNAWYPGAFGTATPATLPSGTVIKLITAPYFLGTKLEAFRGRGASDFFSSHDLEDFIAVVDGRESISNEVSSSSPDLTQYLGRAVRELLSNPAFLDALPGYVLGDVISQRRVAIVLDRLSGMAAPVNPL